MRRRMLASIGGRPIPAIWVGSSNGWFDTGFNCYGKNCRVVTRFYRKDIPSTGMYVVGSSRDVTTSRADPCVIARDFWYVTFGSVNKNIYYKETPLLLNKANTVEWIKNDISGECEYVCNGYRAVHESTHTSTNGATFWLLRRNLTVGNQEPCTNLGLISCDIYDDDVLVKSFRPALVDGVACLKDVVSGEYIYKSGGADLLYIDDIRSDGIEV